MAMMVVRSQVQSFYYHVGGINDRWEFVVLGEPFLQISRVVALANRGDVVIAKEVRDDGDHM